MTIQQFLDKYNGKPIDYDKKFGFQCVDLMRQYIKEVLGGSPYQVIPAADYAKNMFYNYKGTYFEKIYNSPTNSPSKGDIVFWKTYLFVTGIAGHVAIAVDAGMMSLITFDQNWPRGTFCHFQKHSYRGVIGWLHKK